MLTANHLSFTIRGGSRILDGISLDVRPGERLAIIGPNGAGKTTLLRLLAGMLPPTSGSVFLFSQRLGSMHPVQRARSVAVVGQTDQPDRRIRLRDYVELDRIPHSGYRRAIEEVNLVEDALERTGLLHLSGREMGSLSGGERQRAQIARALAQAARILFLDEPTNHLDPRARGELLQLVAELKLTVVAVLHDLHLVPGFATRVAVLRKGMLVSLGPVAEALSKETVRDVFGINLLRLPHPEEDRELTVFDTPLNT